MRNKDLNQKTAKLVSIVKEVRVVNKVKQAIRRVEKNDNNIM